MQCPNCGKDNAPGTRFCVHCGTAQPAAAAPAAPASTVTAAMAQGSIPGLRDPATSRGDATVPTRSGAGAAPGEATQALRAEAAASETVVIPRGRYTPPPAAAVDPAQEAADWLPPPLPPAAAAPAPAPADAPAYATAPTGRSGMLIVLALAAIGVFGIAAFFFYQVWSDHQREATLASSAPASSAPNGPATGTITPPAAPADAASKPDTPVESPRAEPASAAPGPASAAAAPVTEAPVVTPLPAQEPARPGASAPRPPRTAPRTPAPKAEPAPPPPVVAPQPAPAPAPKAAPAAPPRPAPAADRWAQMHDDLQRCTREDFINRVVCDQRVRLRYCDGYWGKVAQCPGAAAADHGQ